MPLITPEIQHCRPRHLTVSRSYDLHVHFREKPGFQLPDQLDGLLSQTQRQDRVRQDARQMREKALVDGKEALGLDRFGEAVKYALVEVAVLVV